MKPHTTLLRPHRLGAVVLSVLVWAITANGQILDAQIESLAGGYRLEQPGGLAVSSGGDQIAIADRLADRIWIVDLSLQPLWMAGEQSFLGSPRAVCFDPEDAVLFIPDQSLTVLRVAQRDPERVDTLATLADQFSKDESISQLVALPEGGYLALCERSGTIVRFDAAWQVAEKVVANGSGQGKVLVPTGMALMGGNRLVVSDRKNYAVQAFDRRGKFLFYGGWNEPGAQRGWSATAVTVDRRDIIWVADETGSQFRLFDGSGTLVTAVAYPNSLFLPVAMTSLADNRVMAIDAGGSIAIYRME